MSSGKQVLPYSPVLLDSILVNIEGQAAKNAVQKIIQRFDAEGLRIRYSVSPANRVRITVCFALSKKAKKPLI